MLAGGLAGMTSTTLLFPLDNLTTRLATNGSVGAATLNGVPIRGVGGIVRGLRVIAKTEGVGALYRGLGPATLGIFPEAAITYGCYDLLKEAYVRVVMNGGQSSSERGSIGRSGGGDPGMLPSLCCGILAALTGQAVAFPAEVISRRMATVGLCTLNQVDP
jgi:solute carrier family 25 phosphate transporter 23/24/25/41